LIGLKNSRYQVFKTKTVVWSTTRLDLVWD